MSHHQIRQTLIRVSSHDRQSGTSPSQFTVDVASHMSDKFSRVVGCEVLDVSIPNVFENINTQTKFFRFSFNAANHVITVPDGYYEINQLLSFLTSELSSILGDAITATISPTNYRITLSSASTTTSFSFTALQLNQTGSGYASPSWTLLGFTPGNTYSMSNGTLTANAPPFLNYISTAYVHCPELALSGYDLDFRGRIHCLASVNLGPHLGYANLQNILSYQYASPRSVNQLTFTLRDRYGGQLAFPSASDWTIVIKVHYLL